MKTKPFRLLLSSAFFCLAALAAAADWPTYLHDGSRVGYTPEPLAAPLAQRWTYASPTAPQQAWAGEDGKLFEGKELRNRITFDDVFHTAIAGGRVFFGSSVDGRVYCRNLATGKEEWNFFTDGPIRLAPMVAGGKLFVGSDDGHVYCLDAATGKVIWKLRAGPNDERILARGRMISRWPVRTGVLVDGGTAYFGAGVFPHENICLYAVEAATGKVIWKNDAISQTDAGRDDLSPQGYLLATKDILFVPSGRSLAASFQRATGEFLNKPAPGWRTDAGGQIGGTQALLADDQIYAVGEHHILAMDQEKGKVGFGWFAGRQMTLAGDMGYLASGKEIVAIDRVRHAEGTRERHKVELAISKLNSDMRKHPALAELKKVEKAQADLKEAQQQLKQLEAAGKKSSPEFQAADAAAKKSERALASAAERYEPRRVDYQTKKDKLASLNKELAAYSDVGIKWRFPALHDSALILAGNTLVAGGKGEVVCLDADSGKLLWKSAVEGEARGLAAASGHLVVSTTQGKIYSFADAGQKSPPPVVAESKSQADPFPKDALSSLYAAAAEAILKQTSTKRGFCLVVGSEQGRLAYELAKRTELTIYCVEADERKVQSSRAALVKTGLYGPRLTVDHLDLSVIPYASYFANLIVSDSLLLTGEMPGIPAEVARNLKPIGGMICLGVPDTAPDAVKTRAKAAVSKWLADTKLTEENAKIESAGNWSRLVRAALPNAGSWSHQYGNAANTSSNDDGRIKGGLGVLWYGDPGPGKMVNRHAGAVGPLSVNGRLFIQGDESVMAYDAYNGQFLWEVENPGALRTGLKGAHEPGNMAASDDSLFVVVGAECLHFDAATGKILRTYAIPESSADSGREWGYLAWKDGLLYGTVTARKQAAAEQQRRGKAAGPATDSIFAFDTATGKLAWAHQGKSISHVSIAIGDGRVFFVDSSLTPEQREELLRQDKTDLKKLTGEARDLAEERIKTADLRLAVALDARTGQKLWGKPVDVTDCSEVGIGGGSLTLIYHNNHIVLGGANANGHYWTQFLEGEFKRRRLVVLDAGSGTKLWAKDANYRHRPIVIDNEIIAEPWGYDLYTGAQKMRTHPLTGEQTPWMFARPGHHCGAISATRNMMFFRSKSTAFYNLDQDEGTEHFAGQRLGCWINTIPANGLVMIPEASAGCVCLFSIAATIVFEPRENRMNWGVYSASGMSTPVQHMALNLGAPGDRRDAHGKLWLGYPRPSSRAGIDLPLSLKPVFATGGDYFVFNEASFPVANTDTPWVFSSGARGLTRCELPLLGKGQKAETYTVRLYFTALENDQPGQRVFDIQLQGRTVKKGFDLVAQAGGAMKAFMAEFHGIPVSENLVVELVPAQAGADAAHQPLVSGIEVLRTNAKEITDRVATR
ncbi:MAG: PQQ-binding-like beta-propeller repeat protein [Verrucomicrobia bacterium]|nr:PQQ-binding-like beta-propeller repeat protein [Verrucomicrobiota bacterium]